MTQQTKTIRITAQVGVCTASEEFEVDANATPLEIEREARDYLSNVMDWSWREVE